MRYPIQGRAKKNLAKFSDTCSIRADRLCIGCLGQWAETGQEKFKNAGTSLHDPVFWILSWNADYWVLAVSNDVEILESCYPLNLAPISISRK